MTLFVPGIPIRSDSKMIKALKCCHKDRDPDRSHVHVQSQVWHFEKKKKKGRQQINIWHPVAL